MLVYLLVLQRTVWKFPNMSIFQNNLRHTKREHANICDVLFVIYASTITCIARIIPDVVTLTATLLTLKYTALTGELSIAVWIILIHKNIFKSLLTTHTTCQMAHRRITQPNKLHLVLRTYMYTST